MPDNISLHYLRIYILITCLIWCIASLYVSDCSLLECGIYNETYLGTELRLHSTLEPHTLLYGLKEVALDSLSFFVN